MSYEGYEQYICTKGHTYRVDASYFYAGFATDEQYQKCRACPTCSSQPVWSNSVDQTNCDNVGYIDMKQFEIRPARFETCNLGYQHLVKEAIYRVPTADETEAARSYWSEHEQKYVPLK